MNRVQVTERAIASLRPYPRNARTHSKKQVQEIVRSIRAFGFANPILIDESSVIIAGHGRLLAGKELGLTDVPTIQISHLAAAQKKALRLADNKIALNAGWDVDQLCIELAEIHMLDADMDLTITGFATGELDVYLGDEVDPEDDHFADLPVKARAKLGDIWLCGNHRVGCGDGRDIAFLKQVVGNGQMVDAAFLDPPYNVKINGHANARGRHREFRWLLARCHQKSFVRFSKAP